MNLVKSSRKCPVEKDKTGKWATVQTDLHLQPHPVQALPQAPAPALPGAPSAPSLLRYFARPTPTSLPDIGSNVTSSLAGEHRQRSRLQIERQAGPKSLSARIRDLDFVK